MTELDQTQQSLRDSLGRWFLLHPDQDKAREIWSRMAKKKGDEWRKDMSERIRIQRENLGLVNNNERTHSK